MDIEFLSNNVSHLMALTLKNYPSIEINTKSAPRILISQLVRQKFVPSYENTPEDLKWIVKGEGDCNIDDSINIIDLLGTYNSSKNKITIYTILIKLCSIELCVDFDELKYLVLLHELSHAITHRGLDKDNSIWEFFDDSSTDLKEYFAQIYTYKKLIQEDNKSTLVIMEKLSEKQSGVYQTYKQSIEKDITELNHELLKARKDIPNGLEVYFQAKERNWEIKFDYLLKYQQYVGHNSFPSSGYGPVSIHETKQEGTSFSIKTNLIFVKSYDYSPPNTTLSKNLTVKFYNIICKNELLIKNNSKINIETEKPIFCFTIDNIEYYLDFTEKIALDIWKEIILILNEEYPVLYKLLTRYEEKIINRKNNKHDSKDPWNWRI